MNSENSLVGFNWGVGLLILLLGVYVIALTQLASPVETGVRVIPWQAPDLEISSPSAEVLPPAPAETVPVFTPADESKTVTHDSSP